MLLCSCNDSTMSDHGWALQIHPSGVFSFPFDVLHMYDGSEAFTRITDPPFDVRPCVQLLIYS